MRLFLATYRKIGMVVDRYELLREEAISRQIDKVVFAAKSHEKDQNINTPVNFKQ